MNGNKLVYMEKFYIRETFDILVRFLLIFDESLPYFNESD